jgi:predicted RNA-binding Zn-ribbon protein involved in translation (DUF1610 family)
MPQRGDTPCLLQILRATKCEKLSEPSLLPRGFSLSMKPMGGHANPDEETTDWRAVCGRTACTVRRTGKARALSDPYQCRKGLVCLMHDMLSLMAWGCSAAVMDQRAK